MAFDDFSPTIKTNMAAAFTAATSAGIFDDDPPVYDFDSWPGSLMGVCALIGTASGTQEYGLSQPAIAHHNVKIWVYFPQSYALAQAMGPAVKMIELVRNQFANDIKLGGNAEHIMPADPFYEGPGFLEYAGKPHVGIIFNYDVKENETGSFSVGA